MLVLVNYVVLLLCWLVSAAARYETKKVIVPRSSFVLRGRAHHDAEHELIFAVQQSNLTKLDAMLMERSTLGSAKFQQWLTFDEMGNLTSNKDGATVVLKWLEENNISVQSVTAHMEYISASSTISVWESLLGTEFYRWEDTSRESTTPHQRARTYHRAKELRIPPAIAPHVTTIFNTIQVPPLLHSGFYRASSKRRTMGSAAAHANQHQLRRAALQATPDGSVTIAFLNDQYKIGCNTGDSSQQQSVFETAQQYFSLDDLALFRRTYGVSVQPALAPYGYATADCSANSCTQGNLDTQYIMGVAQRTTTVYHYVDSSDDPFVAWITQVANMTDPARVHSIAWGALEHAQDRSTLQAFNTEALKLAVQGVTIVAASGDGGVANYEALCSADSGSDSTHWEGAPWTGTGYFPVFPATSPYVTAVGATMGPENGDPETACQSQLGGVITTGGGFSTYNPTPSWQVDAVNAYFDALTASNTPTSGYNRNGRGYPDVSLIGVNYQVVIQGELTSSFGTCASAPVFAAVISLVNAARAVNNMSSVGFLNPALYNATKKTYRDVAAGHNRCVAFEDVSHAQDAPCCDSGFHATAGWDPVTGLGSVTLAALQTVTGGPLVEKDGGQDSTGLSTAAVIGIAVGGAVALLLFATVLVCLVFRYRRDDST